MSDEVRGDAHSGPSQRGVELGVAIAMAVFALIVIYGSIQAGIGWGDEGPKAGFFPFYVGMSILIASVVNLTQALHGAALRAVRGVGPTASGALGCGTDGDLCGAIPWIGIYVSSTLLIAFFMRRLGNYGWALIAVIALGVPLVMFIVFERWFLVPLPKGPIEAFLGF